MHAIHKTLQWTGTGSWSTCSLIWQFGFTYLGSIRFAMRLPLDAKRCATCLHFPDAAAGSKSKKVQHLVFWGFVYGLLGPLFPWALDGRLCCMSLWPAPPGACPLWPPSLAPVLKSLITRACDYANEQVSSAPLVGPTCLRNDMSIYICTATMCISIECYVHYYVST